MTTALITVAGEDDAVALREWLNAEDEFRGRARLHSGPAGAPTGEPAGAPMGEPTGMLVGAPAGEGTMGPAFDTVSLLVTSGGLTAMTTVLVTYLRNRGSKVRITATVGDRSATIEGERLRRADVRELNEVAVDMARQLGEG
ncbi:effector-associated constant component EACC1 [Streptomyces paludis]|nr:hypothetical protein [Streptomyces paludis]